MSDPRPIQLPEGMSWSPIQDLNGSGPAALAEALAKLQASLPHVGKDETAKVPMKEGGSYSYSYADLTAVSKAILPKLAEHGLSFTAFPTVVDGKFALRYHLFHRSGEHLDGVYPLPQSGTPQSVGSAITYARRYCLCAVTGVSPDDDDDAAAAQAHAQAERQAKAEPPPLPQEVSDARDAVRGAWMNQFGTFKQAECAELFGKWSQGEILLDASAARLRNFAAYLSALPAIEAGADPAEVPADQAEPAAAAEPPAPRKITGVQRGRIFASMTDMGMTERAAQLEWLSNLVGRPLKSRGELTFDDAKVVIDHLEQTNPRTEEGGTR